MAAELRGKIRSLAGSPLHTRNAHLAAELRRAKQRVRGMAQTAWATAVRVQEERSEAAELQIEWLSEQNGRLVEGEMSWLEWAQAVQPAVMPDQQELPQKEPEEEGLDDVPAAKVRGEARRCERMSGVERRILDLALAGRLESQLSRKARPKKSSFFSW
eukprot:TRINITY_DN24309_c0_g1_i1.p2 TRINITY_DN24309_c0_g1~~TRINITY_DN24309_c0_g1_i1.p2  ORF type:complete len:159 (+),score=28.21 TRINITY_DN24309_c0_g1_i1:188-664(+)